MSLHLVPYVFLKLSLHLIVIHIIEKFVFGLLLHSHELGFSTVALTVDMLHDLVIGGELLSVLGHDAIHSVNSSISSELLEVGDVDKIRNVRVEDHVVSHADFSFNILIMLALADSVGQTPASASFAIWTRHFLLLRLIDGLVPTHIHKCLLIKELLPLVADHLLTKGLDAKAGIRLDEHGAYWKLTTLFHLSQILVMLRPMLWVRNFVHILAHQILEFSLTHGFGEISELFLSNIHLPSLEKRMVNLLLLLLGLRIDSDPVKVFRSVRVHLLSFLFWKFLN